MIALILLLTLDFKAMNSSELVRNLDLASLTSMATGEWYLTLKPSEAVTLSTWLGRRIEAKICSSQRRNPHHLSLSKGSKDNPMISDLHIEGMSLFVLISQSVRNHILKNGLRSFLTDIAKNSIPYKPCLVMTKVDTYEH